MVNKIDIGVASIYPPNLCLLCPAYFATHEEVAEGLTPHCHLSEFSDQFIPACELI